jgi:hypothetical protein
MRTTALRVVNGIGVLFNDGALREAGFQLTR